ncbi:hypothetical protein ED733_006708 [Metarhizium rileyi]|uniref:Uncharacterized protein n=1 Tax=Metarhizium rileyi (strain RCEF 4871) TaxID=1649241 RepID=A0A5C6GNA6_METRR|nr:hypothetical protein ED733_006708 [Metarhizium rileyi]
MNNPLGMPAHAMLPVKVQKTSPTKSNNHQGGVVGNPLDEATCNISVTQQANTTTGRPAITQNHKKPYNPFVSLLSPPHLTATSRDTNNNKTIRSNMHLHLGSASAGRTGDSSNPSSRRHSLAVSAACHSSRPSTDSAISPLASSRRASTSVPAGAESSPLTAADAVLGLVAASCQAQCDVEGLDIAPTRRTAPLRKVLWEVKSLKTTAQRLHNFLRRVENGTLAHRERAEMIELDVLVVVLAASVLTVSELEVRLDGLVTQAEQLGVSVEEMVQRYSKSLEKDANRINMVDFTINQLLSLLQVSNHRDACHHRTQASLAIMDMLQADAALAGRMQQLQDTANGLELVSQERRAEVASRPPPNYSVPSPRDSDEPPDYLEALGDDSVAIQPRDWSVYSALNLADVPALSKISLPVILGEIKDGYYYTEEYTHSAREGLIALEEAQNAQKSKMLAQVLGIKDRGSNGKSNAASDHVGLAHRLALKVARRKILGRAGRRAEGAV